MAGNICHETKSLKTLKVVATYTTPEEGKAFLTKLADSDVTTLEEINFSGNRDSQFGPGTNAWFAGR